MPRSRSLKPSFFTNEHLGECTPLARLFFAGLWCWADREGYVEDRPRRLKAQILPYDGADGDALVGELLDRGLVQRTTVNGHKVLYIPTFLKHQDPHPRETPSRFTQGEPKANLGGDEQVTSPASPSCPSSPSRPSSPSQPPIPPESALASVPGWLVGIQETLGAELGRPLAVGKDPARVVEAFEQRRLKLESEGYPDPESTLVGDCINIARMSSSGPPGTLSFFVNWFNRKAPNGARKATPL